MVPVFLLVLWLGLLPGAAHAQACDAPSLVPQALRTVEGAGPPTDGSAIVTLPDSLAGAMRGDRARLRYALDVRACTDQPAAALWLFRVGGPYRVSADGQPLALLNARALLSPGNLTEALAVPGVHNGRMPALFALPPGARTVQVELQSPAYFPTGVVRAEIGPTAALLPVQARAAELAVAYVDSASLLLLVTAVVALGLWAMRRADRALLWLGITCGLWGLRGLMWFGHAVYLAPAPFEQLNSLNIALASASLGVAILHMLGGARRWESRALLVNVLVCCAAFAAAELAGQGARAVRALCLLTSFAGFCWICLRAWRGRRQPGSSRGLWHGRLLLAGLGVLLACGLHDLLLLGGALPPDRPSLVFWGFVALLLGLSALSAQYVVLTLNRAEQNAQARERLLRDMHDGLGAQLMTALRGVERGALAPPAVAEALQDSLDELRLLMDSTDMNQYLPGALADWRNRWDPRLAAADVALDWRIDASLDAVQLPGDTVLQVMRILQEAAANVVKHAQARRLSMAAAVHGAGPGAVLRIEILDDGRGLPDGPARAGARGLKNMRLRAQQIGARLDVGRRAAPHQGTQVVLELPLRG